MAASRVGFETIDHSAEITRTRVWVEQLDATNFDELFNPVTGKVSLLQGALFTLTDLNHIATSLSYVSDTGTGEPPATVTAQREIALKVTYRDTVNARVGHLTIPGPKVGVYPPVGTDVVPLDNVLAAAFIAIFEANAVSEDGNPVQVTGIRLIGRNN